MRRGYEFFWLDMGGDFFTSDMTYFGICLLVIYVWYVVRQSGAKCIMQRKLLSIAKTFNQNLLSTKKKIRSLWHRLRKVRGQISRLHGLRSISRVFDNIMVIVRRWSWRKSRSRALWRCWRRTFRFYESEYVFRIIGGISVFGECYCGEEAGGQGGGAYA